MKDDGHNQTMAVQGCVKRAGMEPSLQGRMHMVHQHRQRLLPQLTVPIAVIGRTTDPWIGPFERCRFEHCRLPSQGVAASSSTSAVGRETSRGHARKGSRASDGQAAHACGARRGLPIQSVLPVSGLPGTTALGTVSWTFQLHVCLDHHPGIVVVQQPVTQGGSLTTATS